MEKEIKDKYALLTELQRDERNHKSENIKKLQVEIGIMLENDNLKWRQRAKTNWYKLGDRNTKFFYCATQRRRRNLISKVRDDELVVQTNMNRVFNSIF